MWKQKGKNLIFLLAIVGLSLFVTSHKAFATTTNGINPTISFEGKVNNSSGINITNGTYNMEFKIYAGGTSTGGGTLMWTEDYLVGSSEGGITFNGGTFEVNLGSVCAFSGGACETYTNTAVNWNVYPLYLSLQIGNSSTCTVSSNFNTNCIGDGEMSPYILMTSTPYSYDSSLLNGLSSSSFAQLATANVFQPASNVTGLQVDQTNTASPTADVFDVDTYASSTYTPAIQVTSSGNINLVGESGSTIMLGSQYVSNTIDIGNSYSTPNTDNINIDNSSTADTSTITIGGTGQTGIITLGQSTSTNTINIGAGNETSSVQTINIGNGATSTGSDVVNVGSSAGGSTNINSPSVQIGSNSTGNTTQSLLQLNSVSTVAEAATCSTTSNQGAMYYNTTTNTVRSCVAGSWQDVVTTQDLALQLFGVVPDSGNNPGDLIGASATSTSASNTGGPCKVNYDGTATVYVNSCQAYSGGRLINVAATAISISGLAASSFQNICLDSSGVPALLGTSSTTQAKASFNNLSPVSATTLGQPLLCLATVETTATAGTLAAIFDARTFTNTTKTYISSTGANAIVLGGLVMVTSGGNLTASSNTTSPDVGVAVAYTGAAPGTTGATNAIIATAGPQWIDASAGTIADFIGPTTTPGIAKGAIASGSSTYDLVGVTLTAWESTCNTQLYNSTNCNESLYTILDIH
jgi:fibronectin-binding autotransporter adhesin